MIYFYSIPTQNLSLFLSLSLSSSLKERSDYGLGFLRTIAPSVPLICSISAPSTQDLPLMAFFFTHVLTSPILHCHLLLRLRSQICSSLPISQTRSLNYVIPHQYLPLSFLILNLKLFLKSRLY